MARECSPTNNSLCLDCSPTCPQGTFQKLPCSPTNDTLCAPCTQTCPQGHKVTTPCNPLNDTVCQLCKSCPQGKYTSEKCKPGTDPVCANCSDTVPKGHYVAKNCSDESDTVYSPCTRCNDHQFTLTQCSTNTNTACQDCTIPMLACRGELLQCTPDTQPVCESSPANDSQPLYSVHISLEQETLDSSQLLDIRLAVAESLYLPADSVTLQYTQQPQTPQQNTNSRSLLQVMSSDLLATAYATPAEKENFQKR
eukprot:764418-Hanusia_phi.AAC.1